MARDKTKKRFRKLAVESLETRRVMASLPFGAEADDTGEFMLGRVAVTPVFLESDGSIDPSTENWTQSQITSVLNNIQSGLNWWTDLLRTKSSVHTLDWVIDTQYALTPKSTPYEPISRRSNDSDLWVGKFLSDVGYSSSSVLDNNIRSFNNSQREKLGTDWSFTIFVVNSVSDGDGSFAPGGSFGRAFAFAGGLYEVVPSTRPASTFAHETGHIFWARDEYTGGGNYSQRRGYYNSQNTNAMDLNPNPNFQQETSIMSAGSVLQTAYDRLITSDATLAQIGWKDSDRDGIFDVLDVPLKLEGTGRFNQATNSYRFVGKASVQTLPNRNSFGLQNDITLNRVGKIEYRVDNGFWTTLSTPNDYVVNLDLNIPFTAIPGQIEIRASDSRTGITSNIFSGSVGYIPDTTTQAGIQGFVWSDAGGNGNWDATEAGLVGATISIVDSNNQTVSMQTVIEPDNYESGPFSNPVSGVRLDVVGEDALGNLGIFEDSTPSTGTKIFKPFSFSANKYVDAFRGNRQQLRVRFDNPTSYVSIDAISVGDNADVRLEAFAADGSLIKRFEQKGLLNGQKITLEVGTDSPLIASVIARGFNDSFVKLDNLRFGPKTIVKTASDGSYVLPYLPSGPYRLLVQPEGTGYRPTSPLSGVQSVVFVSGSVISHVDFGVNREASPWQNPRLNEDVNDSGEADPLDVLILVNEININGSRPLDNSGLTSPPFYDVNGDRMLSPIDILQLINYINRRPILGNGEGETKSNVLAVAGTSKSQSPFPSFVVDARSQNPTTWVVSNTNTRDQRPQIGAEKCGCPACNSFSPAGEYSPSIRDISNAQEPAKYRGVTLFSQTDEKPAESLVDLDKLLASWDF
jgi:Dockerin type I domain